MHHACARMTYASRTRERRRSVRINTYGHTVLPMYVSVCIYMYGHIWLWYWYTAVRFAGYTYSVQYEGREHKVSSCLASVRVMLQLLANRRAMGDFRHWQCSVAGNGRSSTMFIGHEEKPQ